MLQVRGRAGGQRQPQPVGHVVQQQRQQHDEGRAEEAARDGAQPADDHHEQQLERTVDAEGRGLPRAQVHEAPEAAGHADDEAAHRERAELGVHRADADHGRGHVHVAHGHPLAAHGAAHEVLGEQREHGHEPQAQQVFLHRRLDAEAQDLQVAHAHRARRRIVGDPLHAVGEPVGEELRGQRRHRQVEPADAQARYAEEHAEHRGAEPASQQCEQQRHALDAHLQVVGRIGAHRHEGARAQRDLPAVAHQDVEPDCRERQDQEGHRDGAEEIVAAHERHADEGHCQQGEQGPAVLGDGEQRQVGLVAGLELAVFAVEHVAWLLVLPAHTRSIILSPNRPCGRISRKPSAST